MLALERLFTECFISFFWKWPPLNETLEREVWCAINIEMFSVFTSCYNHKEPAINLSSPFIQCFLLCICVSVCVCVQSCVSMCWSGYICVCVHSFVLLCVCVFGCGSTCAVVSNELGPVPMARWRGWTAVSAVWELLRITPGIHQHGVSPLEEFYHIQMTKTLSLPYIAQNTRACLE